MKYTIHVGDQPIVLEHDNFESVINVDDLTKIDTSNLFGEAVTISAAVNRIGLLKAEVEGTMADLKLELKIYESNYRSNLRKQASQNGGSYTIRVGNEDVSVKITEKALETCFEADEKWIELMRQYNKAEKNFNGLSSLYWATQDKSRKLNGLVSGTTPTEFVQGLIEGKVNGMLVKVPNKK
jgi:hypothetical protein